MQVRRKKRSWWRVKPVVLIALCLASLGGRSTSAKERSKTQVHPQDLTQLSIEDLLKIEVTSVSRKKQDLVDSAAAIYVITKQDLERSGATSIPEALRMVPGLHVARVDSSKWAVSSRGFNGVFANKMLVLTDGRSIYTPLFAGVFWDVQDILLEDVERIEIIRGPGATMWGSNAVNGVINIITKKAKESQGGFLETGFGTEERGFAGIRYGGSLGKDVSYRAYAKGFNRDASATSNGEPASDDWSFVSGGFRIDKEGERSTLSLTGSLYDGHTSQIVTDVAVEPPFQVTFDSDQSFSGGHLLTQWVRRYEQGSELTLRASYERSYRLSAHRFQETRNTTELDFQHRWPWKHRQDLIWGVGYRFTNDHFQGSTLVTLDPDRRHLDFLSLFVQNETVIVSERLRMNVGAKLERTAYTGLEIQPSVRLLFEPKDHHTLWVSVSRAVRTPSRVDRDVRFNVMALPQPGGSFGLVSLFGSDTFRSEVLVAYEGGYRYQFRDNLSLDLATFFNDYDRLSSILLEPPFLEGDPVSPHLVFPLRVTNGLTGSSHGLELSARFALTQDLAIDAWYSWLRFDLGNDSLGPVESELSVGSLGTGQGPSHQFQVRAHWLLPLELSLNATVHFVDKLPDEPVPSHTRADLFVHWRAAETLLVSAGVSNLFDARHPEFSTELLWRPTLVERSFFGKIAWKF